MDLLRPFVKARHFGLLGFPGTSRNLPSTALEAGLGPGTPILRGDHQLLTGKTASKARYQDPVSQS